MIAFDRARNRQGSEEARRGKEPWMPPNKKELPVGMGEVQGVGVFNTYPVGAEEAEKSTIEACL